MSDFPATDLLGYGLNMVLNAISKGFRIIAFDEDDTHKVKVDKKTYDVPKAIGAQDDPSDNTSGFVHYSHGDEAVIAFRNDSGLAAFHMALAGSQSVARATEKHHRKNNQYAYYTFLHRRYRAYLKNYANLLNKEAILIGINKLTTPFDGENEEVVEQYKSFFHMFGTHIVTQVNFGAHYQLHAWAETSNKDVNAAWAGDIRADYNGIPSKGEFDNTLAGSQQFQQYMNLKQRQRDGTIGGDSKTGTSLAINPKYATFLEWADSCKENPPAIMSFVVDELWLLMKYSDNDQIVKFASQIEEAFNWFVDKPKIYKTQVSLVIESDWAEFGLLTPSAVIVKGGTNPDDNTVWDQTKFRWGRERSHVFEKKTVLFEVVNDGYPIDFYISHGTDGGQPKQGKAFVNMAGVTYENTGMTDNTYNTKWFYQARVGATAAKFQADPVLGAGVSAWDSVLEQYLHHIEAKEHGASEI
ncbi:hypothetical protein AAF712_005547 [Marasmius tenuissimus]|uniref:MACPF domain-containing protein n=1 Tax=Marasmius tenuissimus TaxID=585030 RepID=A0ABR3A037_9AGAR